MEEFLKACAALVGVGGLALIAALLASTAVELRDNECPSAACLFAIPAIGFGGLAVELLIVLVLDLWTYALAS